MFFSWNRVLPWLTASVMVLRAAALCLCPAETCGADECPETARQQEEGWHAAHGAHGHACDPCLGTPGQATDVSRTQRHDAPPQPATEPRAGGFAHAWMETRRAKPPGPPGRPPPGLTLKRMSQKLC